MIARRSSGARTLEMPARAVACTVAAVAVLGTTGCRPTLDDRPWLIRQPQIVAWKAEPPEVRPGVTVALTLIAMDPARAPASPSSPTSPDLAAARWTLCRTPKPIAENRVADTDCLAPSSDAPADATGSPVSLTVPADACSHFGPDTPQPAPGEPPTRPRDPDDSGGYYQPVAVALGPSRAVGLERVTCDLPDAAFAVARAFQDSYRANQNPALTGGLTFAIAGAAADPGALPAGAAVTVAASWPAESAEAFPVFDRAAGTLVGVVERLRATWFVTGGELERAEDDVSDLAVVSTTTTWRAPAQPGSFEIVLVLADSRGGSDVARAGLTVTAGP